MNIHMTSQHCTTESLYHRVITLYHWVITLYHWVITLYHRVITLYHRVITLYEWLKVHVRRMWLWCWRNHGRFMFATATIRCAASENKGKDNYTRTIESFINRGPLGWTLRWNRCCLLLDRGAIVKFDITTKIFIRTVSYWWSNIWNAYSAQISCYSWYKTVLYVCVIWLQSMCRIVIYYNI